MKFVKESLVPASPTEVFAFHEQPGALARLTPPWERFQILEGGKSIQVGQRVKIQMFMGPLPVVWVAEHTEYDPPRLFADRQVKGPFKTWYHRHWFLEDKSGGTLMRDEIDFQPPLGRLGETLGASFLFAKLKKTFDYRHDVVMQFFTRTPQA